MLRSLFSGIGGLQVHQTRLDVVSNNIANVNTTGFKASRVRFSDIMSQTVEIATAPNSGRGGQNPKQIGIGVAGTTISRDMSQGSIEVTNRTMDLAVQGNGFFILRDGESVAEHYTRDGHFNIDADGNVVFGANGFRVQGWNGQRDPLSGATVINSSNPVEDLQLNFSEQMEPVPTSTIEMGGNLDERLSTIIDPIRVGFQKNGTEREVEIRFSRAAAADSGRELFLWRVFDPETIDPNTGDFQQIQNDLSGLEASGIIEVDANGRVIANYLNVADNDVSDPSTTFLNAQELAQLGTPETSAVLWSQNNPTRTFNGYDFLTLDATSDGDGNQSELDARLTSQTTAVDATVPTDRDVTVTVPNDPLSVTASTAFPNGFTQDGVYQIGVGSTGNPAMPGNGLGVPTQYIQSVTNEVIAKIAPDRQELQLAHNNIIDSQRNNPAENGTIGVTTGTDSDSLRLFIDGNQYTRIDNAAAFTAGGTEYKLDPGNGIITLGSALPNGVNAIVSYDYEVRASNTRSVPNGSTMTGEFGARAVDGNNVTTFEGTDFRSIDRSPYYVSGSMSLSITDVSSGNTETFTEIPFSSVGDIVANTRNVFTVDPQTGALTLGQMSNGDAVAAADVIATGTYQTFRRFGGEQTTVVAPSTTVDNAELAFPAGAPLAPGGGGSPYVPGSVGTITLTDTDRAITETFTEVPNGQAIGARQFSIDPTTNDITFGTFFGGFAVNEATDTFANVNHNFDFFDKEIGFTDGAGPAGAGNVLGSNDLWRVLEIPNGGSETGQLNLWLQGDGFDPTGAPNEPTVTSLGYLPNLGNVTGLRAEMNYESDSRVNIIIPNGLVKNPNVDPLVDKSAETFAFIPNTSQITGNNGNNNAADSGDTVSVNFNEPEDYSFSTAVEVFDSLGRPWNVPLNFERLDTNQWLMTATDPTDATGERIAFQRLVAFDAQGNFDQTSSIPFEAPTADGTFNDGFVGLYFDPAQAGGAAPPAEGADAVQVTFNFDNLVQTARTSDAVVTDQNGAPPGKLETFSFNDQGFLVGLFDNGQSMNLGRVALQGFVNPAGLVHIGTNMFRDTVNAGRFGSPQRPGFDGVGTLVPGGLESSNVDLSVEFVDLIITQRGFQAQSRSITTSDQVLQEILTLKR